MSKAFLVELRGDAFAVVGRGETSIAQVARDFGVSESRVRRWLRVAEREDDVTRFGSHPGSGRGPNAVAAADREGELKGLRKRTLALEQDTELVGRAAVLLSRPAL